MKLEEIIALANAGFNKEEIARIATIPKPTQQEIQQAMPQVTQPVQPQAMPQVAQPVQPQAVQSIQQTPQPMLQKPEDKLFESIFGKLDDIQKSVYQQNINSSEQQIETVDDILANILDPKE